MAIVIIVCLSAIALGLALGGAMGAVGGLLVGVGLAAFWTAHVIQRPRGVRRPRSAHEHHRLVCFGHGLFADCDLVANVEAGRWLDVATCSIFGADRPVVCDKACLKLMNDNALA